MSSKAIGPSPCWFAIANAQTTCNSQFNALGGQSTKNNERADTSRVRDRERANTQTQKHRNIFMKFFTSLKRLVTQGSIATSPTLPPGPQTPPGPTPLSPGTGPARPRFSGPPGDQFPARTGSAAGKGRRAGTNRSPPGRQLTPCPGVPKGTQCRGPLWSSAHTRRTHCSCVHTLPRPHCASPWLGVRARACGPLHVREVAEGKLGAVVGRELGLPGILLSLREAAGSLDVGLWTHNKQFFTAASTETVSTDSDSCAA